MFGVYGMESQFDNYGINSYDMWYDARDMITWAVMAGEVNSYIEIDSEGNYFRHECDLGPDAIFPQPLGPMVPYRQGPRELQEYLDNGGLCGVNNAVVDPEEAAEEERIAALSATVEF